MTIALFTKRQAGGWRLIPAVLLFFAIILVTGVLFISLLRPVWSVPWRSYPVERVPEQAHQRNLLWQASQKQQPSLGARLATLPLQHAAQSVRQPFSIFHISARYQHHFCTGDTVLLRHGQQQTHGILRLKVASGLGQQTAQFGIELLGPLQPELAAEDSAMLRLQRVSYQPGDWWRIACQSVNTVAVVEQQALTGN